MTTWKYNVKRFGCTSCKYYSRGWCRKSWCIKFRHIDRSYFINYNRYAI